MNRKLHLQFYCALFKRLHFKHFLFLLFTHLTLSCQGPEDENNQTVASESGLVLPGTDSLLVEQLIKRSKKYYGQGGTDLSIMDSYLIEAENIARKNNNYNQQARIYNLAGIRNNNRANYGEAIKNHQKALDYATRAESKKLLAATYNNIGTVYRKIDDNPMALEMHMKALRLAEETSDSLMISSAINSIGNVNYNLDRHVSSIEYFKRSLEMARQMKNMEGMAINHNNLGRAMLELNEPDSALNHFFTSLDYNYKIDSKIGQSISFNSIGEAYIHLERPYKALPYLEKARQMNEELGNRLQLAISYTKIGKTFLNTGELEKAEENLHKSLELASQIGSLFQKEEASLLLSELHEKLGNDGKALAYYKNVMNYRDSIINEKNIHELATQEAIYDAEEQRTRIEELNQQALQQKNLLIRQRFLLILALGAVIVISFVIVLIVGQLQLRNRYKNVRHQQRLLRSQMNPHFIFNALSAIQVYILEHDIERSSRFLTDFAQLMRQVLNSSNHDYISLKEEAQILQYYLELQRLRFSETFKYSINIDESLDTENIMVPPMLTQPFIENAIEHGLRAIGSNGMIHVRFKSEKNHMLVEVEDNGIGIDASKKVAEKDKKHDSMAIKITRERLEMLRRDSGGSTDLSIMDKKQISPFDRGTLVKIVLPIVKINQKTTNKPSKKGISNLKQKAVLS